jgi:hypothetical protein
MQEPLIAGRRYTTTRAHNMHAWKRGTVGAKLWETILPKGTEFYYSGDSMHGHVHYLQFNVETGEVVEKFGSICTGQFNGGHRDRDLFALKPLPAQVTA